MTEKTILIVDDEPLARQRIMRFIQDKNREFSLIEAENGKIALNLIERFAPCLIFLDIQMPGMSGFDVLYQIPDRSIPIIFQTAFDEYAVKAFEFAACDYLLKPFTRDRFEQAFERGLIRVNFESRRAAIESQNISQKNYLKHLSIRTSRDLMTIDIDQIDAFQSADHYTKVMTNQDEYLASLSLGRLEEILNPQDFMRVHRNTIVRLASIDRLRLTGDPRLLLKSGIEIAVSRRSLTAVKARLGSSF
jgi:two-component system LytT family response regulator